MPNLIDELLPYVPDLVISQISKSDQFPEKPTTESFTAAALFADISGFTSITEQLVARGPQGVEMLSRILNDYFGKLTRQIADHGGDVVNFAGDSLLGIWKLEDDKQPSNIVESVLRCAHRIQKELHGYETGISAKLSMRMGIGLGDTRAFYLGGVGDNWEFILTGDSITQAHFAEKISMPGDVILSSKVWDVIKNSAGFQGDAASQDDGNIRLAGVPDTHIPKPTRLPNLTEDSETSLQSFVPLTIMTHLIAGQMDWLAELRRMTVLFINLQNFNNTTSLEHAERVVRAIQETTFHFEGFLNKIGMDEKGASLLAKGIGIRQKIGHEI